MDLDRRYILFFGIVVVGVIIIFVALFGSKPAKPAPLGPPAADLVIWGVFEDTQALTQIIANYKRGNITYVAKDPQTYEQDLINALASGEGPDIFSVHNTWIPKHFKKLASAPSSLMSYSRYEKRFPSVVVQDFTSQQQDIYATPLYIDTLALYYNKDIFDQSGVALVPTTWDEFEKTSNRIKRFDVGSGSLVQAGVAFGGSGESINRASDIISLLMMQNGAVMTDKNYSSATFTNNNKELNNKDAALNSLDFYTSFANPGSANYTWNDSFAHSIDAFTEGNAGMMLNYSHHIPTIKKKNPFLSLAVSSAPQFNPEKSINFANYWGYGVSKTSKYIGSAWNFLIFAALNQDQAQQYFEATSRPPALRSLIEKNINDKNVGVFVEQSLTARSWLQPDQAGVENIFSDMIKSVITGKSGTLGALKTAEDKITSLISKSQYLKQDDQFSI